MSSADKPELNYKALEQSDAEAPTAVVVAELDETGEGGGAKRVVFKSPKARSRAASVSKRGSIRELLDQLPTSRNPLDKRKLVRRAFSANLDPIYDGSLLEKIRFLLRSPQLNLIIIFLIVLDAIFAVAELIIYFVQTKQYKNKLLFEEFIEYLSLAVASLFLIEILLKIIFTPRNFFRSKMEIFDALIVIASFILEILFILDKHDFPGIGAILTIFRLWRIKRVVNTVIHAFEQYVYERTDRLKEKIEEILLENQKLEYDLQSTVLQSLLMPASKGQA